MVNRRITRVFRMKDGKRYHIPLAKVCPFAGITFLEDVVIDKDEALSIMALSQPRRDYYPSMDFDLAN